MTASQIAAIIVQFIADNLELGITLLLLLITVTLFLSFYMDDGNVPPGPRSWPIVGTYPDVVRFGADKIHHYYMELQRKYGNFARLKFGKYPMVIVSGYDAVNDVFLRRHDVDLGRPDSMPGVKSVNYEEAGVFYTNGEAWERTRVSVMSGIDVVLKHPGHEDHLLSEIQNMTQSFADLEEAEFQPRDKLLLTSMSVHMYAATGKSYAREDVVFEDCFKHVLEVINNPGAFSPGGTLNIMKRLPCLNKRHRTYVAGYKGLEVSLLPELKERRDNFKENQMESILDVLMKAHRDNQDSPSFTDEGILVTVGQFLLGGVWAISYSLDWALLYMAAHPQVQKRCFREVQEVCGTESVRFRNLPDLPYTCATVKEIQRICTIVPTSIPYTVLKDTKINGYDIAKGTLMASNISSVHMDPAHWTDPEQFNPERFLTDTGTLAENPPAFMPFGTGVRKCAGYSYAEKTLTLMFANLVQSLEFSNNGNVNFDGKFTQNVHPVSNILTAKKRN